jgi:long-subunit fatty acid transport protein
MKNKNSKFIGNTLLLLATFILLFVTPVYGAFSKVGMAGMPFLKLGVGRATGMGDAFVAIADDASAAYWNPAGLALLKNREVLVNHIDWILETRLEYLAGAFPTKLGALAVSVTSVDYGQFEETTIDQYQGTGRTFGASDLAVGVSFARMFTDKFAFGATVKAIQQSIWDISSTAVAFDFGTYYNTGWKNVRLAMMIANFGPDALFSGKELDFQVSHPEGYTWPWTITPIPGTYKTEKFPLPVIFRFGVAYDLFKTEDKTRLTFAADLAHYNDINEKVNVGFEYKIMNFLIRGGYILNTDTQYADDLGWRTGLSFGGGVTVHPTGNLNLTVDYAYRDLARLGISHRVTVNVGF